MRLRRRLHVAAAPAIAPLVSAGADVRGAASPTREVRRGEREKFGRFALGGFQLRRLQVNAFSRGGLAPLTAAVARASRAGDSAAELLRALVEVHRKYKRYYLTG